MYGMWESVLEQALRRHQGRQLECQTFILEVQRRCGANERLRLLSPVSILDLSRWLFLRVMGIGLLLLRRKRRSAEY